MFDTSVNKKEVFIMKYDGNTSDKYYGILHSTTVNNWDENDLSREALGVLLHLSTGIAPGRKWTVKSEDLTKNFIGRASEFDSAIQELIEKGYARIIDDVVYIRNDTRLDWDLDRLQTRKENNWMYRGM